jgi:hypothetical protein
LLSEHIQEIKKIASAIPQKCLECINIYHCSRTCPDYCSFNDPDISNSEINSFKCLLNQLLAVDEIKKSSKNLKVLSHEAI